MLGYSVIESKVCLKISVGRRNSLKTIYYRISCLDDNLEATRWQYLQHVIEPINKLDKNAVSLVRTNSHCKGEVVGDVQEKFPLLYP